LGSGPIGNDRFFWGYNGKKGRNILRIGYLNIRGLQALSQSCKDDLLCAGITTYDFDVFGLGELNLDWRFIPENDKLYTRVRDWWESLHLSYGHNKTVPPSTRQKWGGTALLSINKASHRVISKGVDRLLLGRWSWTRYQGRNSHTL